MVCLHSLTHYPIDSRTLLSHGLTYLGVPSGYCNIWWCCGFINMKGLETRLRSDAKRVGWLLAWCWNWKIIQLLVLHARTVQSPVTWLWKKVSMYSYYTLPDHLVLYIPSSWSQYELAGDGKIRGRGRNGLWHPSGSQRFTDPILYTLPLWKACQGVSLFTGLDYWTGTLDWTTGMTFDMKIDHILTTTIQFVASQITISNVAAAWF